ncbi:hypothetical protein HDU96_000596 [Phlyctochytrium bullatum]|nr:hypothetical protein HDU96_000596 [Phlyctochytrium bullatum]
MTARLASVKASTSQASHNVVELAVEPVADPIRTALDLIISKLTVGDRIIHHKTLKRMIDTGFRFFQVAAGNRPKRELVPDQNYRVIATCASCENNRHDIVSFMIQERIEKYITVYSTCEDISRIKEKNQRTAKELELAVKVATEAAALDSAWAVVETSAEPDVDAMDTIISSLTEGDRIQKEVILQRMIDTGFSFIQAGVGARPEERLIVRPGRRVLANCIEHKRAPHSVISFMIKERNGKDITFFSKCSDSSRMLRKQEIRAKKREIAIAVAAEASSKADELATLASIAELNVEPVQDPIDVHQFVQDISVGAYIPDDKVEAILAGGYHQIIGAWEKLKKEVVPGATVFCKRCNEENTVSHFPIQSKNGKEIVLYIQCGSDARNSLAKNRALEKQLAAEQKAAVAATGVERISVRDKITEASIRNLERKKYQLWIGGTARSRRQLFPQPDGSFRAKCVYCRIEKDLSHFPVQDMKTKEITFFAKCKIPYPESGRRVTKKRQRTEDVVDDLSSVDSNEFDRRNSDFSDMDDSTDGESDSDES